MIILREPKVLYVPDYHEDQQESDDLYDILKNYIKHLDYAKISKDPLKGGADFSKIDFRKYSLVIGFSLGGLYAQLLDDIPVIIINPAFGISKKYHDYLYLDNSYTLGNKQNDDSVVFLGTKIDNYKQLRKECKDRQFEIITYPGLLIPDANDIEKKILPKAEELISNYKQRKKKKYSKRKRHNK